MSYAQPERLRDLAERCLRDSEARVTNPPSPALVMDRVRETVDGEVFNLGEVLVTVCEISLNGDSGWGMVMGYDLERALLAAVLDAANRKGNMDLEEDLAAELVSVRKARWARWNSVQSTRVEFEEMT